MVGLHNRRRNKSTQQSPSRFGLVFGHYLFQLVCCQARQDISRDLESVESSRLYPRSVWLCLPARRELQPQLLRAGEVQGQDRPLPLNIIYVEFLLPIPIHPLPVTSGLSGIKCQISNKELSEYSYSQVPLDVLQPCIIRRIGYMVATVALQVKTVFTSQLYNSTSNFYHAWQMCLLN